MAKNDSKPAAPAPAPAPAPAASPAPAPLAVVSDAAAIQSAASVGNASKEMLEKVLKDDSLFERPEGDFWKPETPGDTLIGAYLGSQKEGRLTQHGFAVKSKDGSLRTVRMNGSHVVTRTLEDCRIGRIVKLTWKGKTKTGTDGRTLNQFDIMLAKE